MAPRWDRSKERLQSHVFRAWTALAVLAGFVYGFVYAPEWLTWWKHATNALVEAGCRLLPYPWGDRVEATLGNFGMWVQVTLAILAFRILAWLLMTAMGLVWRRR